MHWQLLWISLVFSTLLAFGFVKFVLWMGMQNQLSLIIPLLPLFYAFIFPVLEKNYARPKSTQPSSALFAPQTWWSGKLIPIFLGLFISLSVQKSVEAISWFSHRLFILEQGWPAGSEISANLLAWTRGDLIRFSGPLQIAFLTLQMLLISIFGGISTGYLSRTNPLLNGLLAGTMVASWMGANQFTPLYAAISDWSWKLESLFGFEWHSGLLLGLLLQAFFFALFSGLGYRIRHPRRNLL